MDRNGPANKTRLPGTAAQRARKSDPALYSQMRRQALEIQLPNLPREAVHVTVMDWHVDKGTVTVVAAADG